MVDTKIIQTQPSGNQTWQWKIPLNEGFNMFQWENHL
jgi:hypothetical protein